MAQNRPCSSFVRILLLVDKSVGIFFEVRAQADERVEKRGEVTKDGTGERPGFARCAESGRAFGSTDSVSVEDQG
jgi:hypothetical protein